MNLKEAFRYQNHLNRLLDEAEAILKRDKYVTKVTQTHLRHKVMAEAEDETIIDTPDTDYAEQITEIVGLAMFLLNQRAELSCAIRKAKQALEIDFDSEVSLNGDRQELASIFKHMAEIRSSEVTIPNGGSGFRFNAEGNQVMYRCDLKQVTTINFDRNKVRSYTSALHRKSDEISTELDRCLVNSNVAYDPPFDVNDSFAEVLTWFIDKECSTA